MVAFCLLWIIHTQFCTSLYSRVEGSVNNLSSRSIFSVNHLTTKLYHGISTAVLIVYMLFKWLTSKLRNVSGQASSTRLSVQHTHTHPNTHIPQLFICLSFKIILVKEIPVSDVGMTNVTMSL